MKVSKRTRDEAIEYCAVMASWWANDDSGELPILEYRDASTRLVTRAYTAASAASWLDDDVWFVEEEWAEAEAMLREGWTPSVEDATAR